MKGMGGKADPNSRKEDSLKLKGGNSLYENIFCATLWLTLELSLIYFITTMFIFCEIYANIWSIQVVGLLAVIHLIAIPVAYQGSKNDKRLLLLLSLMLCIVWFILIIVYIVVFSVYPF